jgi:phosphatidate phosphatase LPIN
MAGASDASSVASDDDVASIATYESLEGDRLEERQAAAGMRVKRYKTMRPTTEHLQKLGLQRGKNSLSFVVWDKDEIAAADAFRISMQEHHIRVREHEKLESKLRRRNEERGGTVPPPSIAPPAAPQPPVAVAHATVSCDLYLWRPNTRVVISDVDGTITKSDALGHVFYWMGRDWTHDGVAQLYQNIARNGYEILYLTSRAIGQVGATKNYLFENVRQPRRYLAGLAGLGSGAHEPTKPVNKSRPRVADADPLGEGFLLLSGDYTPGSAYTKAYSAAPASPARPVPSASKQGTPSRALAAVVPPPALHPGPAAGHQSFDLAPPASIATSITPPKAPLPLAATAASLTSTHAHNMPSQSEPAAVLESAIARLDPRTVALPPGPVITSPDRLIHAFTREVVHRQPQKFKIQALSDILNLFPADDAPFVAGFGNRDTDAIAYRAVRIPPHRVFIINPEGTVRVGGGGPLAGRKSFTGSYWALNDMVNELFPPVSDSSSTTKGAGSHVGKPIPVQAAYSDVSFWRKPLPVIEDSDDDA